MKKQLLSVFLLIFALSQAISLYAQTPTSTASATSPTAVKIDKEVVDLKERVAKSVAENRKKDQKAMSGFAIVKDGAVKVKDIDDETEYEVKIDSSLTKIYQIQGLTKKEVKSDDIKKNAYIIVTGPIVDKTINANIVFIDEAFIVQTGKITELNKTDFYIKLTTLDKDTITLDVESGTKQNMLNIKTLEIERTGFSKIKEGDTIHFVAKRDTSSQSSVGRFAAYKMLIIPQEYFIK
ncbi:hypothetical protein COY90_03350 [Candidatus Roizmanbacteria bacterium CG_4_10_14_0_8_um_filter_39_9]|uniref:DUF5666 domain-containing protein n=1 Tax=Candidatus Roizmanbacteria bacterium CG_4_10_14_0_8_um_filter_39_9 TaxID=1974829 RepID=A0A2M7QDI3_9BACT|nr:MAG: hypothetical protein COY90_03350 [Candidatus Roizmanbacteria bacterium CG_4_10_14_0_8_um_filter_39_9]